MLFHAPTALSDFADVYQHFVVLECMSGSRAYGTDNESSDFDIRGIYVVPQSRYLTLEPPPEQISNASNDIVYYALRRFIELASSANPNFLELLFLPEDCYRKRTPIGHQLIAARQHFVTKRAFESHVAYALSQVKRARGQNKWVNNPKPVELPKREDFCWIIPREQTQWYHSGSPYRPVALKDSTLNLDEYHVASLEHTPGVYRLYHIGESAKGVFRGGKIVCESIPIDLEASCVGLLVYNEQGYDSASRDHRHYWNWRQQRNETRWHDQENRQVDYDAKNMMHTFRLLMSAYSIFQYGEPRVRFTGTDLQLLLDIRGGKFDYEDLVTMAEERIGVLQELSTKSTLPDAPEAEFVEHLLHSLTDQWENTYA